MDQTWPFICNDPQLGLDAQSKKIVRKTAMQAFRRDQRLYNVKKHAREKRNIFLRVNESARPDTRFTEGFSSKAKELCVRESKADVQSKAFELTLIKRSLLHEKENPKIGIIQQNFSKVTLPWSIRDFDPCNSSVLGNSRSWHAPFAHFCSIIAPILQPLGINFDHNPFSVVFAHNALSDPLLLETICFHASLHLDYSDIKTRSPTTLAHEGQVIRLMNEYLKRGEGLDDNVIASTALLAASGHITGDFGLDFVHSDASKLMVKLRGGIQNLGMNGCLESILMLGDALSATINGIHPTFQPRILDTNLFNEALLINSTCIIDAPFDLHKGQYETILDIQRDIRALTLSVSQLAAVQSHLSCHRGVTISEIKTFNHIRTAVEYHLLTMNITAKLIMNWNDQTYCSLYESCRLALLIGINCIFREFHRSNSAVMLSLGLRLSQSLKAIGEVEEKYLLAQDREMLLWISFIGGMMAFPSAHMRWFTERIVRLMTALTLKSWKEVETALSRYFWPRKLRNKQCITLWQDIERLKAEKKVDCSRSGNQM